MGDLGQHDDHLTDDLAVDHLTADETTEAGMAPHSYDTPDGIHVQTYDLDDDGHVDNVDLTKDGRKVTLNDADHDGHVDAVSVDTTDDGSAELTITENPDGTYEVARDSDGDGTLDQTRTLTRSELDAADDKAGPALDMDMPK